jgi:hypothetical protein
MRGHIASEQLVLFADRELSGDASQEVEDHLRTCPECRAEIEDLAAIDAAVRDRVPPRWSLPAAEPSAELSEALDAVARRVLERGGAARPLPKAARAERRVSRLWAALAAAAVIAGAVGIGWLFYRGDFGSSAGLLAEVHTYAPVRGGAVERAYLTVTLAAGGHVYVLNLNPAGQLTYVLPLEEDGRFDDLGLQGPFASGETLRIPPSRENDFELTGPAGTEHLFFIPSPDPLSVEVLRSVRDEIVRDLSLPGQAPLDAAQLERLASRVLDRLRARWPGTEHRVLRR